MEYPYIVKWGRMLHSFGYFIESEIEKARRVNAPVTAVYQASDGTWITMEDLPDEIRQRVHSYHE